jgi:hypothetical protein
VARPGDKTPPHPFGNERLTVVRELQHVARLDVRRGMLDQAESSPVVVSKAANRRA